MHKIDFTVNKELVIKQLSLFDEVWVNDIINFLDEWWNDNDFIIAQTSGSTGEPKRVELKKNNVVNSATATGNYFDFKKGENALLCMSPKFIAGKLMIVRAIVWELNLICVEPNSNPLESIPNSLSIHFAAMVPLQFYNSISNLPTYKIRKLLIGGGVVDNSLLEKINTLDTEVYSSYGMTETITHIALKQISKDFKDYFTALDGVSLSVDDRSCLVISAKGITDTDVVTNDVVELINDKKFRWVGRFDNVINSGGVKIHPEQIEQVLESYIQSSFFISSIKDGYLGNKVVLVVEDTGVKVDLDYLKTLLPKYHSPKAVFYMSEFVRTSSGKINRNKTMQNLPQ